MAEDEAWEARKRREQMADESLTVFLDALQAFFKGKAALYIEPTEVGSTVRFYKDPEPS